MNCTALSVANSNVSYRRTESGELIDVGEQIKVAEFLKYLLRTRLWLLRAQNEEQCSLMQSFSSENRSMLTELEYVKAVQDFQLHGLMKKLVRSQISTITVTADLIWNLAVRSSPRFDLGEYTSVDLRGNFEALRKGSFKLQNHYILTSQLKRKKDERGWEVCEVASNAKRVAIETEESNKLYEDKAKLFKKLEKKIHQMQKMQTILVQLSSTFLSCGVENFDEQHKMLTDIGKPRTWNYYNKMVSNVTHSNGTV
nr:PREDICTED: uncharacterized protein LOC109039979 [Bemisia tabaci]